MITKPSLSVCVHLFICMCGVGIGEASTSWAERKADIRKGKDMATMLSGIALYYTALLLLGNTLLAIKKHPATQPPFSKLNRNTAGSRTGNGTLQNATSRQ